MLSKARFQALLKLTRKQERAAAGMFVVEGWRWLDEVLREIGALECVLATPDAARAPAEVELLARARAAARESFELTPEQLGRLTDNVSAPGVAVVVRWRPASPEQMLQAIPASGPGLVVALDALGDPGNAGTIVRAADWFGANGVLFGGGSVELTNPKTVRATMGSLFHLPIAEVAALSETLERTRTAGFVTIGATLDGETLADFRWPERTLLVVGNEANGIQPEVRAALDRRIRIPAHGRAESLNAAVAAGILMADWRRATGGEGKSA